MCSYSLASLIDFTYQYSHYHRWHTAAAAAAAAADDDDDDDDTGTNLTHTWDETLLPDGRGTERGSALQQH